MTLKELKQKFPQLIVELENETLQKLGVEPDKGRSRFTEEKTPKLTDEEKKRIKIEARNLAGVTR